MSSWLSIPAVQPIPLQDLQSLVEVPNPSFQDLVFEEATKGLLEEYKDGAIPEEDRRLITSKTSIQEFQTAVEDAKARYQGTSTSKSKIFILNRVKGAVETLRRFQSAADVLVQANTEIGSLVWGSIRVLLVIANDIFDTFDRMAELMKSIHRGLERFSKYMGHFKPDGSLLRGPLVEFYRGIIVFSLRASAIYHSPKYKILASAIWTSIKKPFEVLQQQIDRVIDDVDKAAAAEHFTSGQETQHRLIVLPASLEMPQRQANYTVPNLLSPHFIGREEVLLGLSEHFAGSTERHTPRFAALWSMPGVGKSQIAYKFADDHRVDYIDILYFRATTVAQLLSDYRVAATLVLPEHERPDRKDIEEEKRLVQLLQRWFAKNSGWLLIFDNVQKGVDVLPFIPASGDGDIIFTTRNEYLAMSLAPNIKTYKIELLGHSQSVEMVIKIGNYGDDYRDIAGKIANAVGHLPIAIHQSITLSKAHDLSLVTLLNTLEARMPDVMYKEVASALYESSPSTGILFDLAFDMLAKSDPHAAALFKVLIFLDTSSISLGLLRTGGPQISSYLNRPVAYDRGVNRTSAELKLRAQGITDGAPTERTAAIKLYSQLQEEEAKSFRSKLRRSLKAGLPLKSKDAPLTEGLNDRAESDVDKMLRIYLSRDGNLHDVLAAPNLIERSIVSLVNAGLVSNNGMGVYSIHDLVRDLNIARIKKKSKISHEVNSLFALVLVFLAFPIPSRLPLKVADICFQYHSHALSVLRHCKETCFDATAGPEIMHLLASVLDMSDHVIHGDIEEEDAIYWYSQAHKGYVMAAKRERDSKNLFKILREVQEDFDGEVRGACFKRIVEGYERFGQAPRRAIDTALKIGTIALRKNDSTTAQKWLALAVKGYKALLGENHWFVFETLGILASACVIGLEYDDALKCSEQRALLQQEHLGGMSETSGGAGLSLTIGRLLELMRRYDEALRWLHLALSTIDTVWSEGSVKRVSTMLSIARVKRKLGQHAESRDLCAGSLEIQWLSDQEWTRPDPTLYCDALCDFAVSLDALGMSEQAAEELSGALVILKTQFGEYDELAHPITVKYLHPVLQRLAWNLARILSAGGRESQIAEQVSGKLLEHAEERFGPFKGIDFKVNPNLILATDWVQPL